PRGSEREGRLDQGLGSLRVHAGEDPRALLRRRGFRPAPQADRRLRDDDEGLLRAGRRDDDPRDQGVRPAPRRRRQGPAAVVKESPVIRILRIAICLGLAILAGCRAATTDRSPAPPVANPAPPAGDSGIVSGTAAESMNAGGYTYVRL